MFESFFELVINRFDELILRTGEHLFLTGISTFLAILLGIPLGIAAFNQKRYRGFIISGVGILQTIPSLALLAILLVLIGKIGTLPAIIALTLYALLPIVRNTLTGFEEIPEETSEAARGIGMSCLQELNMVKLPLAFPMIVAGIRTAAVIGVGIATLSAFIGAGGLGQFINRGLALSNTELILLGAIPAALLALLVDLSIASLKWGIKPLRRYHSNFRKILRPCAVSFPILIIILGVIAFFHHPSTGPKSNENTTETIRIGSKNFTEQFILSEMMAQLIETHTELNIERTFNLGGTMICHNALVQGEIDIYAEYTGTGLTSILKLPVSQNFDEVLKTISKEYERQFNVKWLSPFGFNNTYAITVRQEDGKSMSLNSISDLVSHSKSLKAGFTSEFAERQDGYPGLKEKYGLIFNQIIDLDPGLMYDALTTKEIDVICAFATDGRIPAYNLKVLKDDRSFFPPYHAAPLIRGDILKKYPEIKNALEPILGALTDEMMQQLNYEVDKLKRTPREVVRKFFETNNFLKSIE